MSHTRGTPLPDPVRLVWQMLCVAAVAFAIFAPTLGFELVWDDLSLTSLVQQRAREGGLWRVVSTEFQLNASEHPGYFRPVVLASLWLDGSLQPHVPWAYHLSNVLLHAACSALVLLLLRRLAGPGWPSLTGALLFAVHPAHTEAVAWVSARTDLWAALFVLLSALAWHEARTGGHTYYWLSLGALLLGVLSKESALVLPAALLAWELLAPTSGRWLERNGRWLLGWALVLGLAVFARWLAGISFGASFGTLTTPRAPVQLLGGLLLHLKLLLVPWPLNSFYAVPQVRLSFVSVLAAAVLLGGGLALAVAASRRWVLVGLAWTLVFLLPVSGLVSLSGAAAAERFLYLPSMGLAVLVAGLYVFLASTTFRPLAAWASAALLVAGGAGTLVRSRVWESRESLEADQQRTSPVYVAMEKNKLATRMTELGQAAAAVPIFQEALALDPSSTEVHNNLGIALATLGRHEEALAELREAQRLGDRRPELYVAIVYTSLALGRVDEGRRACDELEKLNPASAAPLREMLNAR